MSREPTPMLFTDSLVLSFAITVIEVMISVDYRRGPYFQLWIAT